MNTEGLRSLAERLVVFARSTGRRRSGPADAEREVTGQVVRACLGIGECRWPWSTAWGIRGPAFFQTSVEGVLQVKFIQEHIPNKVRHEAGPFALLPVREVIAQEDGCVLGHAARRSTRTYHGLESRIIGTSRRLFERRVCGGSSGSRHFWYAFGPNRIQQWGQRPQVAFRENDSSTIWQIKNESVEHGSATMPESSARQALDLLQINFLGTAENVP